MHIKCPETQLMHKNDKRTRNNSKFKHDTHVLVACSLYVNILAIQTPSFPSVTPFCVPKHNEKIRYTTNSLLERICDIEYLGAPSCLAYAGNFVVYSPPPHLNHTCTAVSRGTERNFSATTEISISPPPPPHPKPPFPRSSLLSNF